MAKKVVIIGGVATGMKTASRLRRLDKEAEITVLERGSELSYGACGFPYYISGEVKDYNKFDHTPQGVLRDSAYFKSVKGIDAHTNCLVTAIDRKAKKVIYTELKSGEKKELAYDKLVLGTGATPVKLNLPGADGKGIHGFWFPADVRAVDAELKAGNVKEAAIIGAGFIGMELAEALTSRGLKTSVIEMQGQVLPQLLDREMADILLKPLKKAGVAVYLGEKTTGFKLDDAGNVCAVVTDKREISAQLVIVAVGVKPNTELAVAAGLTIGPTGCIAVDGHLRTSDPDIYAGGDCAENTHRVSGAKVFAPMGSTANKHGRVIADHIAGRDVSYPGVLGTGVCRLFDWEAGATGLNERSAKAAGIDFVSVVVPGNDRLPYMPGVKNIVLKLLAEKATGRVIGGEAVGRGGVAKRIDTLVAAISLGATLSDLANFDIAYAPPFNGPIDNIATAANVLANKIEGQMQGINPKDFEAMKKTGDYLFLDVRTPKEFTANRVAGVPEIMNLPLGVLRSEGRCLPVKPDKHIITSCQIDLRGYEAEVILRALGFTHVSSLEGGMSAWPYETEKGEVKK